MWSGDTHMSFSVRTNNNNPIWGGSVFTGEEPSRHSGELNHALSQVGGPTQSQLSSPMSSRHHISMEHRLRRKHLMENPNTKARSGTYIEKKKKKETHFPRKTENRKIGKMKKRNEKHEKREKKEKRPHLGTPQRRLKKCLFIKERNVARIREAIEAPQKQIFSTQTKKKKKKKHESAVTFK